VDFYDGSYNDPRLRPSIRYELDIGKSLMPGQYTPVPPSKSSTETASSSWSPSPSSSASSSPSVTASSTVTPSRGVDVGSPSSSASPIASPSSQPSAALLFRRSAGGGGGSDTKVAVAVSVVVVAVVVAAAALAYRRIRGRKSASGGVAKRLTTSESSVDVSGTDTSRAARAAAVLGRWRRALTRARPADDASSYAVVSTAGDTATPSRSVAAAPAPSPDLVAVVSADASLHRTEKRHRTDSAAPQSPSRTHASSADVQPSPTAAATAAPSAATVIDVTSRHDDDVSTEAAQAAVTVPSSPSSRQQRLRSLLLALRRSVARGTDPGDERSAAEPAPSAAGAVSVTVAEIPANVSPKAGGGQRRSLVRDVV
jgi:hypothetical protein